MFPGITIELTSNADMGSIHLTKAHQFWPLTNYMSGFGVPMGSYIERFRLSKKMLEEPEIYIDEALFWCLASDLARREGFLDWGFRAGQQLNFSTLGEFGQTLLRQPSLKVALEVFLKSISSEALQVQFGLAKQDEYTWLMMSGTHNAPRGQDVIELYDMAFMCKLVQASAGRHWRPPSVQLQAKSLPEGLDASGVSSGTIRFSSTVTAIAIPDALIATPMSNYCSSAIADIRNNNSERPGTDFATSLRLFLAGYLDEGITVDDCAEMLDMSQRTLQRRLAKHDTSFNQLLDQTRFDHAKILLLNHSVNVTDISYELGYSNPANFTRAFRRWAGVTPRQHRQLNCQ